MPKTAASPTTGVSRRHGPIAEGLDYPSRFVGGPMTAEPATAAMPPRPFGDLSRSSSRSIAKLVVDTWDGGTST
ncbi:hypothetical protein [Streptomyces venezuelae]|nr:hypothetical protein [Streptomyces venezuelae]